MQQRAITDSAVTWWLVVALLSFCTNMTHGADDPCTYVMNRRPELGKNVYLDCRIKNQPANPDFYSKRWSKVVGRSSSYLYVVEWDGGTTIRDSAETQYKDRVTKKSDDQITLKGVTEADSGQYECAWEVEPGIPSCPGSAGRNTAKFNVTVIVPVKNVQISGPQPNPVNELQPVTITCTAEGTRPITFSLQKAGGVLSGGWQQTRPGRFTLSSVRRGDTGQYRCTAVNELKRPVSSVTTVQLQVNYPPDSAEMTTLPRNLTVKQNTQVTVTCRAEGGFPPPDVTLSQARTVVTQSKQEASTTFQVGKNDNGKSWSCSAFGAGKTVPADREIRFNVLYPPESVTLTSSSSLTQKINTDVTVRCSANGGNPTPDVTIYHDGEYIKKAKQTVAYSIRLDKFDNGKVFHCQASAAGFLKQSQQNLTFNVLYPPDKVELIPTPAGHTHVEKTRVTLTCTAEGGNPPPEVSIEKRYQTPALAQGEQTVTTDVLLQRDDPQPEYICKAFSRNNDYITKTDTVSFDVLYPPAVTMVISPNPVIAGKRTKLTCSASGGNPVANDNSDQWTFSKTTSPHPSTLPRRSNVFSIAQATPDYAGEYTCQVVTSQTYSLTATKKGTLTVYYVADVDQAKSLLRAAADYGGSVEIILNVRAVPVPTFKWQRRAASGDWEDLGSNTHIESSGLQSRLVIKNIQVPDFGEYMCQVTNSAGSRDFNATVEAAAAPETPARFVIVSVDLSTVQLQWLSRFSGGYPQTFAVMYRVVGDNWPRQPQVHNISDPGENRNVSVTVTGLQPGTQYEFRVKAVNERKNGERESGFTVKRSATTEKPESSLAMAWIVVPVLGIALFLIVGVVIYRRRSQKGYKGEKLRLNEDYALQMDQQNQNKPKKTVTKATTRPTVAEKTPLTNAADEAIYGNIDHNRGEVHGTAGSGGEDHTYINFQGGAQQGVSSSQSNEDTYQNISELHKGQEYVPQKIVSTEGIVYEDPRNFDFTPSNVGKTSRSEKKPPADESVIYADIDLNRKPPPGSAE